MRFILMGLTLFLAFQSVGFSALPSGIKHYDFEFTVINHTAKKISFDLRDLNSGTSSIQIIEAHLTSSFKYKRPLIKEAFDFTITPYKHKNATFKTTVTYMLSCQCLVKRTQLKPFQFSSPAKLLKFFAKSQDKINPFLVRVKIEVK